MFAKAKCHITHPGTPDGPQGPSGALAPWLKLALGLALLLLFMFWLGPFLTTSLPGYDRLEAVIREHDINAGAFYYTGLEQTAEGERYLRERLQAPVPPGGVKKPKE